MSSNVCQIDSQELDRQLVQLTDQTVVNNILFKAIKSGAMVVKRKTQENFRRSLGEAATHKSPYTKGGTFDDGVVVRGNYATLSAKVSILSDFRMKFFETGTAERKTKGRKIVGYSGRRLKREGKGHDTGAIKPLYFFRRATEDTAAVEDAIKQSIDNALKTIMT